LGNTQFRYAAGGWHDRRAVGTEVERKFVVAKMPDLGDDTPSWEIEQGYLAIGAEGEVRLRRRGEGRVLTVKRGVMGGCSADARGLRKEPPVSWSEEQPVLCRSEAEVDLDQDQFDALWPLTEGRRLKKRRHLVPHGDLEIELDTYEGELEGLIVAEIEFPSEAEARRFEPADWLGEEVTGDPAYLNETLAVSGHPGR
jgi:adenylate cyclase